MHGGALVQVQFFAPARQRSCRGEGRASEAGGKAGYHPPPPSKRLDGTLELSLLVKFGCLEDARETDSDEHEHAYHQRVAA